LRRALKRGDGRIGEGTSPLGNGGPPLEKITLTTAPRWEERAEHVETLFSGEDALRRGGKGD